MTDKEQIIIDGVDVSGCSVYKNGKCLISKAKCNARCDYGAIYLKEQFARKTQECEEYKKRAVYFKDVNKQLGYKYLTIKQECEELKKENQELRNSLSDSLMFRFTCQDKEVDRYRKALEEIEEYVRDNSDFDKSDILTSKTGAYDILNIINKVKGDNR